MHVPLYAALCLIWGFTWLVIKVGYDGLGPFYLASQFSTNGRRSPPAWEPH